MNLEKFKTSICYTSIDFTVSVIFFCLLFKIEKKVNNGASSVILKFKLSCEF